MAREKTPLKKVHQTMPGKAPKFTPKQMITAIEKGNGFVTVAAKILKCHYTTVLNYMKKYPEVKEARDQINESFLDLAEHTLIKKIKDKDTVSTLFFLKCKGKHRGYVERQELTGADGGAVNLNMKISFVKSKTEK